MRLPCLIVIWKPWSYPCFKASCEFRLKPRRHLCLVPSSMTSCFVPDPAFANINLNSSLRLFHFRQFNWKWLVGQVNSQGRILLTLVSVTKVFHKNQLRGRIVYLDFQFSRLLVHHGVEATTVAVYVRISSHHADPEAESKGGTGASCNIHRSSHRTHFG